MKQYFLYLFILIIASCKKDDWGKDLETTITPGAVTAPDNNTSIPLDQLSNGVVIFEWQVAKFADYTTPLYKVLFDVEGGDFSKPIYTVLSEKNGAQNSVRVSHREMNRIAFKAGIKRMEKGKVKWTIVASNGVTGDTSKDVRTLELQRPAGYAENPETVYMWGSATEAGNDITKAVKFKKVSDGVFEAYTSLTTGAYTITDKIAGTPLTFVLGDSLINEGSNANSITSAKKIYRISLDFNTAVHTITEIQEVGLWFSGFNKITNVLNYDANGIWKAADIAIVWSVQSWGKDERYKFRVVEKAKNGTVSNVFWCSATKDNARPNSSTAAGYFYLRTNDATQWDYTYKFEKEAAKADVLVKFHATDAYTHQVIYK
jgi:starch-binding outer membrane protein SusE/F